MTAPKQPVQDLLPKTDALEDWKSAARALADIVARLEQLQQEFLWVEHGNLLQLRAKGGSIVVVISDYEKHADRLEGRIKVRTGMVNVQFTVHDSPVDAVCRLVEATCCHAALLRPGDVVVQLDGKSRTVC